MTKAQYQLASGICTAVTTAASAIIAYIDVPYKPAIIGGIGIIEVSINQIFSLFLQYSDSDSEKGKGGE